MATVLLLLAVTGAMSTALVLSMVQPWKTVLAGCALVAAGLYASHFWLIHVSFAEFSAPATTAAWHPLLSLILSIESALVITASTLTPHAHADRWPGTRIGSRACRGLRQLIGWASRLPPLAGVLAAIAIQAWLFHEVSHWGFATLSLYCSAGVVVAALTAACAIRTVIPRHDDRSELRVWVALFQAALAIALPVVGLPAPAAAPFAPAPGPTAAVFTALIALLIVGSTTHRISHHHALAHTES